MLDYLTMTLPAHKWGNWDLSYIAEEGVGMHGYKKKHILRDGTIVLTGGNNETTHLIMSGKTLRTIRNSGLSDAELLEYADIQEANYKRIDIALDYDVPSASDEIERIYQEMTARPMRRTRTAIRNDQETRTIYAGSLKTRTTLLRVYDKSFESALDSEGRWLRIEGEFRKPANMVRRMMQSGATESAIMAAYFKQMSETFDALLAAEPAKRIYDDTPKNPEAWLLNIAAVALNRRLAELPEAERLQLWQDFKAASWRGIIKAGDV